MNDSDADHILLDLTMSNIHFADSTLDIPEDPQKLAHIAAAPFFGPPIFEEAPCTISLIEWMNVEVTPQVVWILDPISAKVPQTNTHLHTLCDHSTAHSIRSVVWDFESDLEFFKLDVLGLLPADDDNDNEPGPSSKHVCFMAPPANCWNKEDLC